ncbi:MAG: hypothetical protein A3G84_07045 [Chloroflexi bacterium RIFCSPLOWO2_12_FULL_71_12]|nr:MAG: hypothetical protein A3H36_04565 [Chloroflexi bacterium RIFCSPLOWO2_02_FULL_71_16]OGO73297.1 MAG: hypothetical protein A3G84_07045 [Chloroflexi bacterium RIFCSPLOWO2_12_FULL_71_12]
MCRSIKRLRTRTEVATDDEIREAARQYVRKVTGFGAPTARHQAAFDEAVDEITAASRRALRRISRTLEQAATVR